jgi:hypothetical protein
MSNLVLIEPELADIFPDAESVNRASNFGGYGEAEHAAGN